MIVKFAMMLPIVASTLGFGVTVSHAKALDLGVKSPEYMKTTCAKVKGIFVDNEGKMSCVFPRGVVRCNQDSHCYGYPKHPRPIPRTSVPRNPESPVFEQYQNWQWHDNNYRW
jgi:hypothetical protein